MLTLVYRYVYRNRMCVLMTPCQHISMPWLCHVNICIGHDDTLSTYWYMKSQCQHNYMPLWQHLNILICHNDTISICHDDTLPQYGYTMIISCQHISILWLHHVSILIYMYHDHIISAFWYAMITSCQNINIPCWHHVNTLICHDDTMRNVHSYGGVTIAGECLCSALVTIQQWGFFSVPNLLWQGASV